MASATAMDAIEIGEFLEGQLTGVLALAMAGRVYAFPVSFAYRDADSSLYFRLGYGPASQKRSYVEGAEAASFVVYDRTDAGWKSVMAEGHLEPVSETGIDGSVEQAVRRLTIPFFQVHQQPADGLEHHIVRLRVEKLSGVAEARGGR